MRDLWNEGEKTFGLETLKAGREILSRRPKRLALICWGYM